MLELPEDLLILALSEDLLADSCIFDRLSELRNRVSLVDLSVLIRAL